MYAIINSGNRQYKVSEGDKLRVEKLSVDEGQSLSIDKVLLLVDGSEVKLGRPYVDGAKVNAKVLAHGRSATIRVVKMKRRKNYRKTQGHRQHYSELVIESIVGGG